MGRWPWTDTLFFWDSPEAIAPKLNLLFGWKGSRNRSGFKFDLKVSVQNIPDLRHLRSQSLAACSVSFSSNCSSGGSFFFFQFTVKCCI